MKCLKANLSLSLIESGSTSSIATEVVPGLYDESGKVVDTFLLTKFDAVFVGAAKAIEGGKSFDLTEFKKCLDELLNDKEYQWSIEEFVNDKNRVEKRIQVSISKFSEKNK